jgi:hypothetical protein
MMIGIIRAFACSWIGTWPVFRFLVLTARDDWRYIYVPASNYAFRPNDLVSFDCDTLYWHTPTGSVPFQMLCTGMEAK